MIRNFAISIGDMVNDLFGVLLYPKTRKYPSACAKVENFLRCQFLERILSSPWDRETRFQMMSVMAKPWDLTVLVMAVRITGQPVYSLYLKKLLRLVSRQLEPFLNKVLFGFWKVFAKGCLNYYSQGKSH